MDLLLLITALVNAIWSLPLVISIALPIIAFILATIIVYREESRKEKLTHITKKSEREDRFIRRLNGLVDDFVNNLVNVADTHSITSIANEIVNDGIIRQHRPVWGLFLSHLNEDLTKKGILLNNRIDQRKTEFKILFQDFATLLSFLRKFKNKFYEMVADTKKINQSFVSDSQFKIKYGKFSEKFNKYMDKLDNFSDEVKAEFEISLSKNVTEHIKGLDELYMGARM